MSIEMLNHALRYKGLTPTKKFILVLLGNYCDESGSCYPSYRHIADVVGLKDTKGVKKAIKEFQEAGLLRIENRYRKDGGLTSNRYHLLLGVGEGEGTPTLEVAEPHNTKDKTKTYEDSEKEELFDIFWKDYPRKVSKKSAKKIFMKYKNEVMYKIITGARKFAFYHKEKGTSLDYIPHPSTWLNGERWEDSILSDKNDNNKSLNNLAG